MYISTALQLRPVTYLIDLSATTATTVIHNSNNSTLKMLNDISRLLYRATVSAVINNYKWSANGHLKTCSNVIWNNYAYLLRNATCIHHELRLQHIASIFYSNLSHWRHKAVGGGGPPPGDTIQGVTPWWKSKILRLNLQRILEKLSLGRRTGREW